jgi:hypothetical protein
MNVGRYLRGDDRHVGTSRITKPKDLKMNEKIKELLAKHIAPPALAVTRDLENQHTAHVTYTVSQAEMNNLLEAVVQECINLNGKELAMSGHSRMVDVYCEHFGIEV